MRDLSRYVKLLLVLLSVLHLGVTVRTSVAEIAAADGYLNADGASPVGGDFINMFAAGRLVLAGQAETIYQPEAFMAFERTIIPHEIGLRLWAYPPHSLLAVWPLGFLDFWTGLTLWSALGLAVLVWGARRAGFDWMETAIITLSPAAVASVYYGQTGNVAAGLLLLALAAPRGKVGGALAAGLLTVKPQAGFLLPVVWLIERKFLAIAIAGGVAIALAGASALIFGPNVWRDYLGSTLPLLNQLEREGTGPFLAMIPSAFIAMRLYAGDPVLASYVHGAVAVAAGAFGVWQMWRADSDKARWAIAIAAMALITPYIHIYDLAPVVAAALLVLQQRRDASVASQVLAAVVAIAVWALPFITVLGNSVSVPIGVLVLVSLLVVTGGRGSSSSPVPALALTEKSQP